MDLMDILAILLTLIGISFVTLVDSIPAWVGIAVMLLGLLISVLSYLSSRKKGNVHKGNFHKN